MNITRNTITDEQIKELEEILKKSKETGSKRIGKNDVGSNKSRRNGL